MPSRSHSYSSSLSKRFTWPGELSLGTLQNSRNGGTHSINTSFCSVSKYGGIRRTGCFLTNSSRCLGFTEPFSWRNSPLLRRCVSRSIGSISRFGVSCLTLGHTPSDHGVVGIDASGFDRSHTSKHYTKSNAILDVHARGHENTTQRSRRLSSSGIPGRYRFFLATMDTTTARFARSPTKWVFVRLSSTASSRRFIRHGTPG
mgnify:CR=1 FL=1